MCFHFSTSVTKKMSVAFPSCRSMAAAISTRKVKQSQAMQTMIRIYFVSCSIRPREYIIASAQNLLVLTFNMCYAQKLGDPRTFTQRLSWHGNSRYARGLSQLGLVSRHHLHGHHRFHLHLLLPCSRTFAIHSLQEAQESATNISREYEVGTARWTASAAFHRAIGRTHHRWISHHLSAWRVHLLYCVCRQKCAASE